MSDTTAHLRRVKRQLYKNLIKAYRGWWQWHKVSKNASSKTAVILMPTNDKVINRLSMLYLDEMLGKRKMQNAIILSADSAVAKSAKLFSKKITKVIPFSREKAELLLQYYCLYEFDRRFIVASLDEPYGRNGSALIGQKGTTVEEIFAIGVYRLFPFKQRPMPEYIGSDEEVVAFMQT